MASRVASDPERPQWEKDGSTLQEDGSLDQPFFAERHDRSPPAVPSGSRRVFGLERRMLRRLLKRLGSPPVAIVLWDGREIRVSNEAPLARVTIRDRRTLYGLCLDPDVRFGDSYADGRIEVEGDLSGLLEIIFRRTAVEGRESRPWMAGIPRWLGRLASNTISRSRRNVYHHYDLGNDFYRLWLDRELLYTCAYFRHPEDSLEDAQRAKMDHVCRKVWLQPGESVVEAGCGWGALALHMARHYGVRVRAFNLSRNQVALSRGRAEAEGLADRVEFVEDDYRNIQVKYDVFVSLGMLEHVGPDHYRDLGRVIARCLKPGGRGLVHSIGRDHPIPMDRWILKRIFPGAVAPTIRQMVEILEPIGMSVLDVENLRRHYALTLEHWRARFERAVEQVRRMYDDHFVRTWRLYLSGSRAGFTSGALQLFQVTFARSGANDLPWTREYLYRDTAGA